MSNKLIINLIICLVFLTISVFSQTPPQPSSIANPSGQNRQNQFDLRGQQPSRNDNNTPRQRQFFPFKAKRNKEQEQRLKPNSEDLSKYAGFLKQPKTGIFRLFNDLDCESNVYVIKVDEACQNSIPGGSFYSFREKEYTTAYLADIRFKQGLLISDGVLSQNVLVKLGDIPLENLSLESDGIRFLNEFVPETLNTTATTQFREIVKGIKNGTFEYRKVLPAFENTTYAIRAIAYRGSVYRNFRGWIFNLLEGDKRADLIIAFRVIRKEKDGSVTLLWKELNRKKSPKFEYEKKKKKEPPKQVPYISNKTMAGN